MLYAEGTQKKHLSYLFSANSLAPDQDLATLRSQDSFCLRPSQQCFSHVGKFPGFLCLANTCIKAILKMSTFSLASHFWFPIDNY